MTFTDALGEWQDLGLVTLNDEEWKDIPIQPAGTGGLVRVHYGGNFEDIKTWRIICWFRQEFFTGSIWVVEEYWERLYPKAESEIFEAKFPPEFIASPLPSRQFQVKKSVPYIRDKYAHHAPEVQLHFFVRAV